MTPNATGQPDKDGVDAQAIIADIRAGRWRGPVETIRKLYTETLVATSDPKAAKEAVATLKKKLPVHIGYWTAWVDADNTVVYTDDPYGIDAAHARLRAGQPRPVTGTPTGV